jgi:hypothetical protein
MISRTAVGLGLLVLPGIFITAFIVAAVVAPIFGVSHVARRLGLLEGAEPEVSGRTSDTARS